ncbi:MAG: LptA/OstA family protein [Thermodesulfovibrionales bacterium]
MKNILLLSIVYIFIFLQIANGEDKLLGSKGPIVITSTTLTADNKARTALFEGSVIAKSENMTLYSDKMLVYYTETGKITKIEATGHIKLIRGERVITSDSAIYLAGDEKVIFTGEPRAMEGNSIVTGTKMTYFLNDDRSIVENSKVIIKKEH